MQPVVGIIGGTPVGPNPFFDPVVTMFRHERNIGTAIAIGRRHAITVAHCLQSRETVFQVRFTRTGASASVVRYELRNGIQYTFDGKSHPPDLSRVEGQNDMLAVIKLSQPVSSFAQCVAVNQNPCGTFLVAAENDYGPNGKSIAKGFVEAIGYCGWLINTKPLENVTPDASGSPLILINRAPQLQFCGVLTGSSSRDESSGCVAGITYIPITAQDVSWIRQFQD